MPGTTVGQWQGSWVTATAYVVGDQVTYGGNSYLCIAAHTSGAITPANTSYWSITTAQGAAGATGPAGVSGFAQDATIGAVGAVLLRTAASGAHPLALTTDDLNTNSGPAGLSSTGYHQVVKGTPYDLLGTPALTSDGTDIQMVCPRNFSVTAGTASVLANPAQTVTITLQRAGVNVGTISISTSGVVTTTGFGTPIVFTAGQTLATTLAGTANVSGLLYAFAGRVD